MVQSAASETLTRVTAASLQTSLASGGALLAVLMLVPGAFVVALLANLYALAQHVDGVIGTAGDEGGREPADVGAVAVEPDAGHHHGRVRLIEAGVGAEFAGRYAAAEGVEHGAVVAASARGGGRLGHIHK